MPVRRGFLLPAAFATSMAGTGFAPAASGQAQAAGLRMTVEKPHFTCEGNGAMLSHIAYRAPAGPVLPCCDGRLGCAQFLSTSTVVHSARPLRG